MGGIAVQVANRSGPSVAFAPSVFRALADHEQQRFLDAGLVSMIETMAPVVVRLGANSNSRSHISGSTGLTSVVREGCIPSTIWR